MPGRGTVAGAVVALPTVSGHLVGVGLALAAVARHCVHIVGDERAGQGVAGVVLLADRVIAVDSSVHSDSSTEVKRINRNVASLALAGTGTLVEVAEAHLALDGAVSTVGGVVTMLLSKVVVRSISTVGAVGGVVGVGVVVVVGVGVVVVSSVGTVGGVVAPLVVVHVVALTNDNIIGFIVVGVNIERSSETPLLALDVSVVLTIHLVVVHLVVVLVGTVGVVTVLARSAGPVVTVVELLNALAVLAGVHGSPLGRRGLAFGNVMLAHLVISRVVEELSLDLVTVHGIEVLKGLIHAIDIAVLAIVAVNIAGPVVVVAVAIAAVSGTLKWFRRGLLAVDVKVLVGGVVSGGISAVDVSDDDIVELGDVVITGIPSSISGGEFLAAEALLAVTHVTPPLAHAITAEQGVLSWLETAG